MSTRRAASDKVVITGRYALYGLEQYYYCVTPTADTSYLLKHIVDEDRRDDLFYLIRTGLDRYTMYEKNLYPTGHNHRQALFQVQIEE